MGKFQDLTGQRFGRLTVVNRGPDRISPKGARLVCWNCRCDCGNMTLVDAGNLRGGNTKSCGCLKKETSRQNAQANRKYNKYEIQGNIVVGTTTAGDKFLIDIDDLEKIKEYTWRTENGHVVSHINDKDAPSTRLWLHRHILNVSSNEKVDHINHNGFDNRKGNLRIVVGNGNQQNKSLQRNNKSSVHGVHFMKRINKWSVRIGVEGKRKYLGVYKDFDEAVAVRKSAEDKYYGDYSYDNSMSIAEQNGCKDILKTA